MNKLIKKLFITIILAIFIITLYKTGEYKKQSVEKFDNFNPRHVFWTGGYDSTFRICELLIIHKLPVQPVYLSYNLDSKNTTDFWVRKNRNQEKEAMNKIRDILNKRFPFTRHLLYNTIIIANNIDYPDYDKAFLKLNLWPKKRKTHQYGHLGKASFLMKTYIDTGVLGIHNQTHFINFLTKNLYEEGNTYKIQLPITHPMHYLQFPLFKKSKKDLCDISKKHNFNDIIKLSWSCWFPEKGKPCKKCPMCIERFECN